VPDQTNPPTSPQDLPAAITRSRRLLVLYACIGFILISSIEGTIVATVMPEIVGDLGGFELFSWVFTGYLLTQAVIIPIYGRLADVYGRRNMLLVATALFALGSILCGCAWNMLSLIAFRVAQGVGAGGLVPVSQTVVGDLYTPVERARISAYLSSMWAIGSIIGPLLGAFLIAHTVWSMVFWINVPIAAIAATMLMLWLKEEPQHHERRIDYLGAVLLTAGSALLMFALVETGQLDLTIVAALVAVGLVLLIWFFRLEQRSPDPMLPVALLKNRMVAAASLGGLFSGAILMGATAFVSVFVQGVMGRSALVAGLVLTTPSVTWVIGSMSSGWLMLRSSYRAAIVMGGIVLLVGGVIMVMLDANSGPFMAGAGVGLVGIGMGFTTNTYTVSAQGSVGWTQRGTATSMTMFMRQVGQAAGAAIFGGTMNAELVKHGASADIVDRIMSPALRATIPPDMLAAMAVAIETGLNHVYWITLVLAFAVMLTGLLLPPRLNARIDTQRR
jgi:EmrB/QacA subfamily drug resistance transporter